MRTRRIFLILCILICLAAAAIFFILPHLRTSVSAYNAGVTPVATSTAQSNLPAHVDLSNGYWAPQTFNNCAESALSMDMSFYNVNVTQQVLADLLRPDNNTTGKGDDKSTTPDELAAGAEQYGLVAYYRADGSIDLLKQLTAAGFPVIVRTLFIPSEPVAHYRVVLGYDDASGDIIEEDGFQGAHVTYSYDDFMGIWKYYDYEYIVLAKPSQEAQVQAILGKDTNATTSWQDAANTAQQQLQQNPSDALAQFNLSVANYYLGNYAQSVAEYETAAPNLPPDTLWYRLEPIEAYYELGDYSNVFSLAQSILAQNPAYPELYVVEGESYLKQGNTAAAQTAFQTALTYNKNLASAQEALASMGN